jgi:formate hydrogenlyase transcriptional activator
MGRFAYPIETMLDDLLTTEARASAPDRRYRALLDISKAINAHLDLADVLGATVAALETLLPVDSLAVITIEGEEMHRQALHVKGIERRPGESFDSIASRALGIDLTQLDRSFKHSPEATEQLRRMFATRQPEIAEDLPNLLTSDPVKRRLAEVGIRAVAQFPLFHRDQRLGIASFAWRNVVHLTEDDLSILRDVCEVLVTAVANSLAYEEIRELRDRLQVENSLLREELDHEAMFDEIIGTSPVLKQVLRAIERVAPNDSTVLLFGETGTGKELLARAIHKRSKRAGRTMVKVNCAALPESLIASELFGHEKGAFTGALQRRAGRFELASGGTLFLDEIGELPADVQAVLLRVLQEGEFERVGGTQTIRTDARLIAATNRDLQQAVASGRFRDDLYYRLNVFPIVCPPLRERKEDLPLLIEYFVERFSRRMGRTISRIDRGSMDRLMAYGWPGNIRELQNVVERAMILSDSETFRVEPGALPEPVPVREQAAVFAVSGDGSERGRIEAALVRSRGRVAGNKGAATALGMPASTLEWKIIRLGIDKHRFKSRLS